MEPSVPVTADLEQRRGPGIDPWWSESWNLDFGDLGLGVGGYVRLTVLPNQGLAWYWTAVVGPGRPLVTVLDHEVPLPRFPSVEVRTEGLWADMVVETPLDHVTVGVEAFAVALDDPADVFAQGWGHRVPYGLDLEWEADGPAAPAPVAGMDRYVQSCRAHGEVLVADEAFDLDGWGHRDHGWGVVPWAELGWWWLAGRLDDGTLVERSSAPEGGGPGAGGRAVLPGDLLRWETPPGEGDTGPAPAVVAEVMATAPVSVDLGPRGAGRLVRAWCRLTTPDGRSGQGWAEWNEPVVRGRR